MGESNKDLVFIIRVKEKDGPNILERIFSGMMVDKVIDDLKPDTSYEISYLVKYKTDYINPNWTVLPENFETKSCNILL